MIDPARISAVLVTRGNVDMQPILDTIPYGEIIVWDNSTEQDSKIFGRYRGALRAAHEVVYFQDDDVIFTQHQELLDAYDPDRLVANWAHGETPAGLEDVPLVGAGALVHRTHLTAAVETWQRHHETDGVFLFEADFALLPLIPYRYVHLPFVIREIAYQGDRLCDQPWQREAKYRYTNMARAIRDRVAA